jgi:ATP-binding cassette subfamily D (ALD) protein 4
VGISVFTEDYDSLSVSELSAAISKNAFFSMYLLNNFSTVVDTAVKFSEIVGYTHRIGELMEFLDKVRLAGDGKRCRLDTRSSDDAINQDPSINSQERSQVLSPDTVTPDNDVGLELKNLSIAPPHQSTPLIEGLNMKLFRGKNVLVLGDSGCGKSSILRVLRGLWRPLRGCASITCEDSPRSILFLPQKSYLTTGSLRDQVTFPEKPKQLSDSSWTSYQSNACACDSRIFEALSLAGLVYLIKRLGGIDGSTINNWYDAVSPGEMQKIGFARLFYHQPQYAVLDEATSSLSEEDEMSLYSTSNQLNITILSIGHRSTLQRVGDLYFSGQ